MKITYFADRRCPLFHERKQKLLHIKSQFCSNAQPGSWDYALPELFLPFLRRHLCKNSLSLISNLYAKMKYCINNADCIYQKSFSIQYTLILKDKKKEDKRDEVGTKSQVIVYNYGAFDDIVKL